MQNGMPVVETLEILRGILYYGVVVAGILGLE